MFKAKDKDWKKSLTTEQYNVCRLGATEQSFSGQYLYNKEKGMYYCVCCDHPLFSSDTKFESGSGWPSFYDVSTKGNVRLVDDNSYGMHRIEVRCANCDAHLGHVFDDAPQTKTGKRYCINSLALDFKSKK